MPRRRSNRIYFNPNNSDKIIFNEFQKVFEFVIPQARPNAGNTLGEQSSYQVFLSASDFSSFVSGDLSSVNLSSVDMFG